MVILWVYWCPDGCFLATWYNSGVFCQMEFPDRSMEWYIMSILIIGCDVFEFYADECMMALGVIWINIYIVWVESWDSDVRSPGVHVLCAALYVFIMYRFITSWVVHDAASTIVISYTYFFNIRSCVISTVVCCHDDSLIMFYILKPLFDIFIMSDYIVMLELQLSYILRQ